MKSTWRRLTAVSVLVAILAVAFASLAFAEGEQNAGSGAQVVLAYIAGKTGADIAALREAYKAGKTLQEIAADNSVDWAEIEALVAAGGAQREEKRQKAIERLQTRVSNLTDAQARIQDRIAKGEERIANLEARIPNMKDATLKGFAERQIGILQQGLEQANGRLSLVNERLQLSQDMLAYLQSL